MSDERRPTDGPEGAAGGDGEGRQRLEAVFAEWDKRRDELVEGSAFDASGDDGLDADMDAAVKRMGRPNVDMVHLLGTLTVLATALATWALVTTQWQFLYWLEGGDAPVEVPDLRERYRAGERRLDLEANRWVSVRGLVTTYDLIPDEDVVADAQAKGDPIPPWYFLCPMFDIVVRTDQPAPYKPPASKTVEIDEAFIDLLASRRAYPHDLTVSLGATGRLARADQVQSGKAKMFARVARAAGVDPRQVWVLIDGDAPADYVAFAVLWVVAPLVPLGCLGVFVRAWLRRRRRGG